VGLRDLAQVHARYIAGLLKVNRYVRQRAPALAHRTRRSGTRFLRSAMSFARPGCPDAFTPAAAITDRIRCFRNLWAVCLAPKALLGPTGPKIGCTHVCSMFARMSRYGPVAGGTTRQPVSRFAVQPGTS